MARWLKEEVNQGEATEQRPATSSEPFETNDVMAAFRQAARGKGWISDQYLFKETAKQFGYERLGSTIKTTLKGHMRAAIRRQIFERDGNCVRLTTNSLSDYARDYLRDVVCSVIRKGSTYEREDIIHAVAHHLGFRRVSENARNTVKSAINSGIRQGLLGYQGLKFGRIMSEVAQQLKEDIPAPLKLRDMIEEMAVKELHGPVGGEEEEVDERIRDRYLVGILATQQRDDHQQVSQDDLSTESEEDDISEGDFPPGDELAIEGIWSRQFEWR